RMRVDLALRDARSDRYVAGVLSDGPSYGAGETARDRDRLRDAVLEGLGWRLARVWSTEWIVDAQRELARVRARLEALRSAPPAPAAAGANATLAPDDAAIDGSPPPPEDGAAVREDGAPDGEEPDDEGDPEYDAPEPWKPYVPPVEPPRTPADLTDAASAAAL